MKFKLSTSSAVNKSTKCRNKSGRVFENGWLALCSGSVLACLITGGSDKEPTAERKFLALLSDGRFKDT